MAPRADDQVKNWPAAQPVAMLILGNDDSAALRAELSSRLATAATISDWWLMEVENHMVEAPQDAARTPHSWATLLQFSGGEAARGWLQSLRESDTNEQLTIFLARPLPRRTMLMIGLMRYVLNRMPLKFVASKDLVDPKWQGGANPSAANIALAQSLPQHEAIGVLNMHRYKKRARDPYSGAEASGKRIASVYIKRGFKTFMRSGGHVSWAGANLGQLRGPEAPQWQEIALVWYPGRDAFFNLSREPKCARTIPYRKEGMDIASVTHTRIIASSRHEDVRA